MSVAVFTSIMGGYDELHQSVEQSVEVDWRVFTDAKPDDEPYDLTLRAQDVTHPRMRAKYIRTHPHVVLPDYEISIWVDGSFKINSEHFVADCLELLGDSNALFFPHRWRDCIYSEAQASDGIPKYDGQPLWPQVDHYREQGMPEHWGLVETGCLVRRHNAPEIIDLDEAWWEENVKWSYQDQLSLPYLLWKQKTSFKWMPFNMFGQPWFSIEQHLRND